MICLDQFASNCCLSGDHALTGLAIGKMLGISGNNKVVTGPEIDAMTDAQLAEIVNGCNIYARASPENKLRIVTALQVGDQDHYRGCDKGIG